MDMNSNNDINNRMATLKLQRCDIANKNMKANSKTELIKEPKADMPAKSDKTKSELNNRIFDDFKDFYMADDVTFTVAPKLCGAEESTDIILDDSALMTHYLSPTGFNEAEVDSGSI